LVDADAWQFGAKRNIIILNIFIFSAPSLSKNRFCIIEGADIFWRWNKFSVFQKKIGTLLET